MIDTCPIHFWAKETPEKIAIETGSVCLDYRTLDRRVASLAQQLARQGFVPGDRLVVPAKGSLDSLLLAWACLRAGLIFCPLNPAFPVTQQLGLAKQPVAVEVNRLRTVLFELRTQAVTEKLENPQQFGYIRRDIARLLTESTTRRQRQETVTNP